MNNLFKITNTSIPDCYEIIPKIKIDNRGYFIKSFQKKDFNSLGLKTNWKEIFYSHSKKNVLRGMHLQLPPNANERLVYCIKGQIKDVLLDLRIGSPSYGKNFSIKLSSKKGNMIYIPRGVAHGFRTFNEPAIVIYHSTELYKPNVDTGVKWDSANIKWGKGKLKCSIRDNELPNFREFKSPFRFKK